MALNEKGQNMKALWESLGPEKFMRKMDNILEGENPLAKPEDFSIKEIFEAVDPTAFPVITGKVLSKKIMDSYELAKKVGDALTTTMKSKLQTDRVPGFTESGDMKIVKPGEPYDHVGDMGEKYVTIEGDKYGKILDVVEEAVIFDQTGKLLLRAAQIGEGAAAFREKHIMYTIQDIAGFKAYHPSGVQTALYSGGHKNQITNVLEDHTDLDAANKKLGLMTDEKGDPIVVMPNTLLVPIALDVNANRLYKSSVLIGGANAEPNPFSNRFNPVASPYLDAQSATAWYLGNFKKQFVWKEVIPMQVLTRKSTDNEPSWERDIVASYKVRYYGECGALDFRFVCKSTGA